MRSQERDREREREIENKCWREVEIVRERKRGLWKRQRGESKQERENGEDASG